MIAAYFSTRGVFAYEGDILWGLYAKQERLNSDLRGRIDVPVPAVKYLAE